MRPKKMTWGQLRNKDTFHNIIYMEKYGLLQNNQFTKEYLAILNVHVTNNKATKYMKQNGKFRKEIELVFMTFRHLQVYHFCRQRKMKAKQRADSGSPRENLAQEKKSQHGPISQICKSVFCFESEGIVAKNK